MPPSTSTHDTRRYDPPISDLGPYRVRLRIYRENLKHNIATRVSQVLSDTRDLLAHIAFLEAKCKATAEKLDAAEVTIAELIGTTYDDAEQIAELKRRVAAFERDREPRNTHQQEHRERESTRATCGWSSSDSRTLVDRGRRGEQQAGGRPERRRPGDSNTGASNGQYPTHRRDISSARFPPPTRRNTTNSRPIVSSAPIPPTPPHETPASFNYNGREYIPGASTVRRPWHPDRRASVLNENIGRTGTGNGGNGNFAPMPPPGFGPSFSANRRGEPPNPYGVAPYDPITPYGFTSNTATPNMNTRYADATPYGPDTVRCYTNDFLPPGNYQR